VTAEGWGSARGMSGACSLGYTSQSIPKHGRSVQVRRVRVYASLDTSQSTPTTARHEKELAWLRDAMATRGLQLCAISATSTHPW